MSGARTLAAILAAIVVTAVVTTLLAPSIIPPRTVTETFTQFPTALPQAPTDFNGPTFTNSSDGLRLEATLSTSSLKVGTTLWVKGRLTGPSAWSISLVRFIVIKPSGEEVYDVYTWLPHRTLALGENPPQEYDFDLAWEARKRSTTDGVEITPGSYFFIIRTEVEAKELGVKGTIEVE